MKRLLMIAAVLAMSGSGLSPAYAKICLTGVACGNTCIPKGKACSVKPTVTPSAPAMSSVAAASTKGPKHCVKGKACGNSCIAVKDICHK